MKNTYVLLLAIFCTSIAFSQQWYPANNPEGGLTFVMTEAQDGSLLLGSGRGIYRSIDGAESWTNITGMDQSTPSVSQISVHPNGTIFCVMGFSLYKSTDLGESWILIQNENITSIGSLTILQNGDIMLVSDFSIWRSADLGENWTEVLIPNNSNPLGELAVSPDGDIYVNVFNDRIYRSTDNGNNWELIYNDNGDPRNFAFIGTNEIYASMWLDGIIKSTDNGDTWTLLEDIPGTLAAVSIYATSSGSLFASTYEDEGIFESTDGGESWSEITDDIIDESALSFFESQSGDVFAMTRAGGVQKRAGNSWESKNSGMIGTYLNRFGSDYEGRLYACMASGLFISEDGGTSFFPSVQGLDDPNIYAATKSPNGYYFCGGEEFYRSTDGLVWENLSQGFPDGDAYIVDLIAEENGRLVAATDEWGVRYSDDNGESWSNANGGLADFEMEFIHRSGDGTYFTSDNYNLYRSTDLSQNWETISGEFLDDFDVVAAAAVGDAIFAASYSDGLFRSTDGGLNWELVIDQDFDNLVIHDNELYGSSASVNGGVYLSADEGDTWMQINDGLPEDRADEILWAEGFGLFANTDFGLYTLNFSVNNTSELNHSPFTMKAFPNPFKESTTIEYSLRGSGPAEIWIVDLRGRTLDHRILGNLASGTGQMSFDEDYPSGLYFVSLRQGEKLETLKIIKAD